MAGGGRGGEYFVKLKYFMIVLKTSIALYLTTE
jgi:hypothetical protein